jgi:hypothetical protein
MSYITPEENKAIDVIESAKSTDQLPRGWQWIFLLVLRALVREVFKDTLRP